MSENSKEFLLSLHSLVPENLIPIRNEGFRHDKIPCCDLLTDESDTEHVLKLNNSGAIIWGLCTESRSVGDIINMLADAFEVERADMARDVSRVVEYLLEERALINSNNVALAE